MSADNQRTPGDLASEVVKRITDSTLANHSTVVTISAGLAYVVDWLAEILQPYLLIDPSTISPYPLAVLFTIIGIVLSNLKPKPFPKPIEDAIRYIELAKKRANLPEAQVRLMYTALNQKLLQRADLNLSTEEDAATLGQELQSAEDPQE